MSKTALTPEEEASLKNFIAEAVLCNAVFPSHRTGVNSVTIQELIHTRNVDSLRDYGTFIWKQEKNESPFAKTAPVKVSGIEVKKIVAALELIIKNIEFENYKKETAAKLKAIDAKLENLKTPQEQRAELEAEKASLLA